MGIGAPISNRGGGSDGGREVVAVSQRTARAVAFQRQYRLGCLGLLLLLVCIVVVLLVLLLLLLLLLMLSTHCVLL